MIKDDLYSIRLNAIDSVCAAGVRVTAVLVEEKCG